MHLPLKFQRYPLWMKNPNETSQLHKPVIVSNIQQETEYKMKGYVAPALDEEFFNDATVRMELAKQLLAIMMASNQYTEEILEMRREWNDLRVEVIQTMRDPSERIDALTKRQDNAERALEIIRAFLSKIFPKKWGKTK